MDFYKRSMNNYFDFDKQMYTKDIDSPEKIYFNWTASDYKYYRCFCETCVYHTNNYQSFKKHINTKMHKENKCKVNPLNEKFSNEYLEKRQDKLYWYYKQPWAI